MRILVLFMLLVIAVALAGFVSLNRGHAIENVSLGVKLIPHTTLNVVVAWTFWLGVVWAMIIFVVQEIRLRIKISRLRSNISRLQGELDQLRTIPLAEIGIEE